MQSAEGVLKVQQMQQEQRAEYVQRKFPLTFISVLGLVFLSGGLISGMLISNIHEQLAVGSGMMRGGGSGDLVNVAELSDQEPVRAPPAPDSLSLRALVFGDIFVGRRVHTWAQESDLGYAYPFSGLDSLERERYDAWIGNLECPVTAEEVTTYQEERLLKFACRPEYLPEAAKWFDAFSLANNHTDNMEEFDGLTQTRNFLDKAGIQYFGHYDNAVQDDICEIVTLPVTANYDSADPADSVNQANSPSSTDSPDSPEDQFALSVALCGYHNIFKAPTAEEIAVMRDYSEYFITIAMPHQGLEYVTRPDGLKQRNFRAMIDNGADFVLGGHPHVVQTVEAYNGKFIAYSLVNFIFDQQGSYDVRTGIAVELDFDFDFDGNLRRWTELARECEVFKDNCLELARISLTKPNFELNIDIIATSSANRLTKKGSEQDQQQMLSRTGFESVRGQLDY